MTPERIEEVKKVLEKMNPGSQLFPITVGDFLSLLVALEESQQQTLNKQIEANEWEDQYMELNRKFREQDFEAGETLDLLKETSKSLAEARQSVEKLTNLFKLIDTLSYIKSPAYSAVKAYVDLALRNE